MQRAAYGLYGANDAPGPSPYSENYLATFAATTIQRWYRGYRARKEYLAKRARIRRVELAWATHHDISFRNNTAARVIQTAWRAYRNRRIYNYYRDLIRFRERGDPRELLKVINPREAQLADAAAGIHVRFRLGGTVFPPLVFYKIFTHRPVTDICAFGPRDYANEVRLRPGELHNWGPAPGPPGFGVGGAGAVGLFGAASSAGLKAAAVGKKTHTYREGNFELDSAFREYLKPDGTTGIRSTEGWYERYDNNGWRPVSERALLDEDPVTTATRLKRQPLFHYNPAVRREQRARLLKQRKREWLRKVYLEGAAVGLRPPGTEGGSDASGYGSGEGGKAIMDLDELDEHQLDSKAEELLAWSEHLDFRSYFDDWTSMACTLASEAFIPEDETPYLEDIPAPHGDVRAALAAAGVPTAPFKGGATPACSSAVLPLR